MPHRDEQTTLLSGRTINPEDYDPFRAGLWTTMTEAAEAEFPGGLPDFHADARPFPCYMCGISVSLGPKQQALLSDVPTMLVACWICMFVSSNQADKTVIRGLDPNV